MPETYNIHYQAETIEGLLDKIHDLGNASEEEAGLMSVADKTKLDGIASGAQVNVLEGVKLGGTALTPTDKVVNIPMDDAPTAGSNNPVKSGALKTALDAKGTYSKPSGGIPKSDLASSVQDSLDKADTIGTKADKDTDAVIGNLAEFDSNGNPVDSGISAADVDRKGSYDENAVVGASEGLINPNLAGSAQSMVGIRAFSGKNGLADIKQIEGKTIAWNQLVQNGNFADTSGWSVLGGSLSVSSNIATITADGAYSYMHLFRSGYSLVAGHKVLYLAVVKAAVGKSLYYSSFASSGETAATGNWQLLTYVETLPANPTSSYPRIAVKTVSSGDTAQVASFNIFDLTLLGIDNLTTVAEVEAWLAVNVGLRNYYPYDAGSLLNNDADAIVARGFNQWDEQWEGGSLNANGQTEANANRIRSKNYIPVIGGQTYYFNNLLNNYLQLCAYDANKNFIEYLAGVSNVPFSLTLASNVAYLKWRTNNGTTSMTAGQLCINLSDASRNGQYEPYKEVEKPLNLKEIKVKSPNIWDEDWQVDAQSRVRSKNYIKVEGGQTYYFKMPNTGAAIDCYDADYTLVSTIYGALNNTFTPANGITYIKFVCGAGYGATYANDICINLSGWANGRYFPHGILTFNGLDGVGTAKDYIENGMLHRKMAEVDLGNYNYSKDNNVFYTLISDAQGNGSSAMTVLNLDRINNGSTVQSDKTQGFGAGNKYYYIRDDSAYAAMTYVQFKTAMSGVKLRYELATEEVYELAEPFNGVYRVFEGGTEEVVNENLSAPFLATIAYNEDVNERLLDLSKPGFAGNLVDTRSAGTPQGPYAFRQSGGDGVDYMVRIKGKTEAFNQIVDTSSLVSSGTHRDVVFTYADGLITANGTANGGPAFSDAALGEIVVGLIQGHTYYLGYGGGTADAFVQIFSTNAGNISYETRNEKGMVFTCGYTATDWIIRVRIAQGYTVTNEKFYLNVVDLTLEGLGLTTAAAFQSLHPLPYYAYNAGVLKNNAATGIKSRGFNAWDGTVVANSYVNPSTGATAPSVNYDRTDYIPVIGGQTYYIKGFTYAYAYDAGKNFLGALTIASNLSTLPASAAYVILHTAFQVHISDKTLYWLNLSDASRNGTYEPYWERTLALGLNSIPCHDENNNAVVVNGLDGVGSAYDEAVVENGLVTKIVKRFAEVDLGNLTWSHGGSSPAYFYASISGRKQEYNGLISPKFTSKQTPSITGIEDNQMVGGSSETIYIRADSYGSDPAAFKTAMNGVKLRYELATPKVLTIDNPFPAFVEVDNLGTQERLPADTAADPQGGFASDSNYSISTANLLRKLNS